MAAMDIKVPDIGDVKDVAVIELLVKVGDTVALEQSLVTVESDKASMEIPSSAAGVVTGIRVKVGDVVNEGDVLLTLDVSSLPLAGGREGGFEPHAASPANGPGLQARARCAAGLGRGSNAAVTQSGCGDTPERGCPWVPPFFETTSPPPGDAQMRPVSYSDSSPNHPWRPA